MFVLFYVLAFTWMFVLFARVLLLHFIWFGLGGLLVFCLVGYVWFTLLLFVRFGCLLAV